MATSSEHTTDMKELQSGESAPARYRCSQCFAPIHEKWDPCPRCGGAATVSEGEPLECDPAQSLAGVGPTAPPPTRSGIDPWVAGLGAALCIVLVLGLLYLATKRPEVSALRSAIVPGSSAIQHFSEENFAAAVLETSLNKPVIVEFYADWCSFCRDMEPVLEQVALEMGSNALVGKINNHQRGLMQRYGVLGFPTLLIIRDGEVKQRWVGGRSKNTIIQVLKTYAPPT